MLLKDDYMGFFFYIMIIYVNIQMYIYYCNYFELVYCMLGEGEIEVVGGKMYLI